VNPRNFSAELKRRNVYKVAVAYAVVAWLLIQIATQVFPFFEIPNWAVRLVILAIVIGFPIALLIAWAFELTPEGLKRTDDLEPQAQSRRPRRYAWLYVAVIAAICSIGLFFVGRYTGQSRSFGSAASQTEQSIAVLPFADMSVGEGAVHLSDGITDEIINALAQIPALKVAARTSAFQFKGQHVDLRKVGEMLGVAYVLEGSVQKSGDDLRIIAQLVDARSGYHMWSERYDRKLTSIFAIEDEIAKAIAAHMRVTLGHGSDQPLVKRATENPEAHEFYLKGLASMTARGAEELENAVQFFTRATELDPQYAAAWAGLSQAHELVPWYDPERGHGPGPNWDDALAKAREAAQRALALDDQLAEAHTALANVLRDEGDYGRATNEYRVALQLSPGSAETLNQYGQLLFRMGRLEEAAELERKALALDPLAPNPRYLLGLLLGYLHHYEEGLAEEKAVLARTPGYTYSAFEVVFLNLYLSRYVEAEAAARVASAQANENPEPLVAVIQAVADPAKRPAALTLLKEGKVGHYMLGGMTDPLWSAMLGAHERALDGLEQWLRASQKGERFSRSRTLWDPAFDPLRDNDRFKAIMRSLGLPDAPIPAAGAQ
jgi:adenylate cyclase